MPLEFGRVLIIKLGGPLWLSIQYGMGAFGVPSQSGVVPFGGIPHGGHPKTKRNPGKVVSDHFTNFISTENIQKWKQVVNEWRHPIFSHQRKRFSFNPSIVHTYWQIGISC
jgi:hypothetical protein